MPRKNNNPKPKHYKTGLELEIFTLDQAGKMVNGGLPLIQLIKNKRPDIDVTKEAGKNMIELATDAEANIPDIARQLIDELEVMLVSAQELKLLLYPFGAYPGSYTPGLARNRRYQILEKIMGRQFSILGGRLCGLHCHFTLPKGVFDTEKRDVKALITSKHKESMINIFNLAIALDPALACFAQSSPFYQGKYLGKDSRLIVYRGGEVFDRPVGNAGFLDPKYGGLPPYITTGTDLKHAIESHFDHFKEMLDEYNVDARSFLKHKSVLSATWAPVRINASGTTEQRGMDSNLPSIVIALAMLVKFIAMEVQEKFIEIVPSDEALQNPFLYKDRKILVPPDSHVRTHLQAKSALEGLENQDVFRYCSALLKLGKKLTPKNRRPFLKPLEQMLKERKTVSDRMLAAAKEMGINPENEVSNSQAAEFARHFSHELYRDLLATKHQLAEYKE